MGALTYSTHSYAREAHEAFLKVSWCRKTRQPWEALASRLRRPETLCLVASVAGDADSLLGWACVDRQLGAVVWCYVRDLYGQVRRRGLATNLLLDCGVDVSQPTRLLFWSDAAEAIAQRGYRIYHEPEPLLDAIRVLELRGYRISKPRRAA